MKLAEALQLRTTITEAIARIPSPVGGAYSANATTAHRGADVLRAMKAVGQAKALTDSKNWRIKPEEGLSDYMGALPAPTPILEFDVEAQQMVRQLEAIDAVIQEANFTNKSAMPTNIPPEPGDKAGVKKTLSAFLLRRKTLKDRAKRLELYLAALPQKPTTVRARVNDTLEDLTITYPVVNAQEARQTLNQTMQALRIIDNLIQQANWAIEVNVPTWVKAGFVTDAVEPVQEQSQAPILAKRSPAAPTAPKLSPVSPMTEVPTLKAATPGVTTAPPNPTLFIPPEIDEGETGPGEDHSPDSPGWGA